MSKIICKKCHNGTLIWVDENVDDLDGDMKCKSCGHIFKGMGNYIDYDKCTQEARIQKLERRVDLLYKIDKVNADTREDHEFQIHMLKKWTNDHKDCGDSKECVGRKTCVGCKWLLRDYHGGKDA